MILTSNWAQPLSSTLRLLTNRYNGQACIRAFPQAVAAPSFGVGVRDTAWAVARGEAVRLPASVQSQTVLVLRGCLPAAPQHAVAE